MADHATAEDLENKLKEKLEASHLVRCSNQTSGTLLITKQQAQNEQISLFDSLDICLGLYSLLLSRDMRPMFHALLADLLQAVGLHVW